eukprot:gnl/Spiro4/27953_TR13839_c0_g1_i1.p1 gnl/Spiro4/27953_TR13839_c0_g1~~gnl/Spiro4/27953_TR13839_c0_g1_i1.p1  ORF type:complete len:559 (+),score=163.29 gnl/Spiro4/27953_TR13839_c0_g1_i1:38-1714(+)
MAFVATFDRVQQSSRDSKIQNRLRQVLGVKSRGATKGSQLEKGGGYTPLGTRVQSRASSAQKSNLSNSQVKQLRSADPTYRQQHLARYLAQEEEKATLVNMIQTKQAEKAAHSQKQPRAAAAASPAQNQQRPPQSAATDPVVSDIRRALMSDTAQQRKPTPKPQPFDDDASEYSPPPKPKNIEDDPWGALANLRDEHEKKLLDEEAEKQKTKRLEVKRRISDQILDNKARRAVLHEEDVAYGQLFLKEHDAAVKEDQRQAEMQRQKRLHVRAVRLEQIQKEEERKKAEAAERAAYEQRLLRRTMRGIEADKKEQLRRKLVQKEIQDETVKLNNMNIAKKQELRQQEKERDIELMKAYSAKLEAEEQARRDHYAMLDQRMHRHTENYWLKAGATLAEKQASDEAKAQAYQEEHARQVAAEDDRRLEKIRQDKEKMRNHLHGQMAQHEAERQREIAEGREWYRKHMDEVERDRKQIKAERDESVQRKNKYATDLNNQMKHIAQYRKDMQMNEHERKMNAQLLKQIMSEDQLKGQNNYRNLELAKFQRAKNLNVGLTNVLR